MRKIKQSLVKYVLSLSFLVFVTSPILLSAQSLTITDHHPNIDGRVTKSEYSLSIDIKDGKIFLSRNNNNLFAAIKAKTSGWVAMGFNSLKMNNADIIIGYVDSHNKIIKTQKGAGRKHKDSYIPYLLKSAIHEKDGSTTLEVELKIGNNVNALPINNETFNMITAYGSKDDLKSYHRFRKVITINIK